MSRRAETIILAALATGMFVLVVFAAAALAAFIDVEPRRPAGCAGRNPPSLEHAERGGCGRTAR